MKKYKGHRLVMSMAIGAAVLGLAGCGGALSAPADFTFDGDGNYSFTAAKSASRYVIEVFAEDEAPEDNVITANMFPDVQMGITGGSDDVKAGTVEDMGAIPYGDYIAYIVAYGSDGNTETAYTETFRRAGKLPTPEVTAERNGWGCTVELSSDSVSSYQNTAAIYGFTANLYSDEACTQLVGSAEFGNEITQNPDSQPGPNADKYLGDTAEFTIEPVTDASLLGGDGFLVTPVVYYVQVVANGNDADEVESSDASAVVSVEINGDKPEEVGGWGMMPK